MLGVVSVYAIYMMADDKRIFKTSVIFRNRLEMNTWALHWVQSSFFFLPLNTEGTNEHTHTQTRIKLPKFSQIFFIFYFYQSCHFSLPSMSTHSCCWISFELRDVKSIQIYLADLISNRKIIDITFISAYRWQTYRNWQMANVSNEKNRETQWVQKETHTPPNKFCWLFQMQTVCCGSSPMVYETHEQHSKAFCPSEWVPV